MATKYCASCKKTVSREWPHSCYDADALERRQEAEKAVVEAADKYEAANERTQAHLANGLSYAESVANAGMESAHHDVCESVRALRALDASEGGA